MLSSTILVGELQNYFQNFIVNSSLNKNKLPIPVTISDIYFYYSDSFIKLLFDEEWNESEYKYLFLENDSRISWPTPIKTRLMVYANSAKYYELTADTTSGINFFSLQSDDLTMLDSLHSYKSDSTSFTMIDSTGTISFDATTNILYATYDNITTNLGKLIYLYLQFKINDDYTLYDNDILVSDQNNILEMAYECYLIDEIFKYISMQGTT